MRSRIDRLWLACQPHANQPVPAHWLALVLDDGQCGWVDPSTAQFLAQAPSPFALDGGRVALAEPAGGPGDRSQALQFAAQRLREAGVLREWRAERLDVRTLQGRAVGTIERSACRALGIETRSVQLNAFLPDGSVLTARRASHKLSDPNRWDNLAGGMIAAGEEDLEAVVREAHEEAGLRLVGLPLARGARFRVQRMVPEGLMVETVQVFDVRLEAGFVPVNLDGEVAGFQALGAGAALDGIERGDFTLQASMALLDGLRRALDRT